MLLHVSPEPSVEGATGFEALVGKFGLHLWSAPGSRAWIWHARQEVDTVPDSESLYLAESPPLRRSPWLQLKAIQDFEFFIRGSLGRSPESNEAKTSRLFQMRAEVCFRLGGHLAKLVEVLALDRMFVGFVARPGINDVNVLRRRASGSPNERRHAISEEIVALFSVVSEWWRVAP